MLIVIHVPSDERLKIDQKTTGKEYFTGPQGHDTGDMLQNEQQHIEECADG